MCEGGHASILPPLPRLSLAQTAYNSAQQFFHMGKYQQAVSTLRELTGGISLPPILPPPSTLHLLTAKALLCCNEWSEGENECDLLITALQPTVNSFLREKETDKEREGVRHTLTFSQALWLRALARVHLDRQAEAKRDWQRYIDHEPVWIAIRLQQSIQVFAVCAFCDAQNGG